MFLWENIAKNMTNFSPPLLCVPQNWWSFICILSSQLRKHADILAEARRIFQRRRMNQKQVKRAWKGTLCWWATPSLSFEGCWACINICLEKFAWIAQLLHAFRPAARNSSEIQHTCYASTVSLWSLVFILYWCSNLQI